MWKSRAGETPAQGWWGSAVLGSCTREPAEPASRLRVEACRFPALLNHKALWICTWESFIFSGSPLGSELGDLEVSEAKLKTRDMLSGCKKELYCKNKKTRLCLLDSKEGKGNGVKGGTGASVFLHAPA